MRSSQAEPLRILFLSSSPDVAARIQSTLAQDGSPATIQRVDSRVDFSSALDTFPDLILFDQSILQFTYQDGLHVLKTRGHEFPVILITETAQEDAAVEALRRGVSHVLTGQQLGRLSILAQRALQQKQRREQEEHYRGIFENSTLAIWDEDFSPLRAEIERIRESGVHDFRAYIQDHPEFLQQSVHLVTIVDANTSMLKLYHTTDKAHVLGSLAKFVPPTNFRDELIAFAEGSTRFEKEITWPAANGQVLNLLMSVTYYTDFKGCSKALVHLTEITERKQAERAVLDRETRYRTLVEQIPAIVYRSNPGQHIGVTYISPRIAMLGYSAEEWEANPELWVRCLHPDDRGAVLDQIEQNKFTGQAFRAEYRLIARDGTVRWFLDEVMDVADSAGSLLFRQGVMLDITQRKLIEESLSSREHFLELLNDLTHTILLSSDFDSTFQVLAFDLKKIIEADDCYILRWDDERHVPIPVLTTASLDFSFTEADVYPEEIGITAAILRVGHVVAIDDVYNSPHIDAQIVGRYPAKSIIGMPLIAGNRKLGVAILAYNTPHAFTQEEISRAEQAGDQVALALWNFQQSAEIQQKLKENNALAKIERALSESEWVGSGKVLQLIVDSARELMPHAEKSVIHILDVEEQTLSARAVSGFSEHEKEPRSIRMRPGEGVAGQVMREGVTINIGDIHMHPNFVLNPPSVSFRSLLVAPVQSGAHHIGTISVHSKKLHAFTGNDAELLKALAIQAAIALENTRLFETTQQRLKEVNILYQISRALALSLDADQLFKDMIGLLQQIFGYYYVQIYLIDPATGNPVLRHGSGSMAEQLLENGHHLKAGEGIVGHVAETGAPFVTNNVDDVVFFKRNPLLPETQYEIAVPIKIDQQVIGVLDIQQTPPHRFSDSDLQLMTAIADHLAVVLQKANLYSTLQTALQQEQMIRSQLVQSERLALVGRLLASVSHELNNPLQAIQNALFLLKEEKNISLQARQDLDVILSEAERMAALIERLRSAYRPVRIRDFQPVDLNNLIEDVHALISTHMRQKMIVFEFLPDPELHKVSGLSDQLRQVVLNLFLNAVEVMDPGGRLVVSTQNVLVQNEVILTIKDTGPGIEPEILPKIFDAFITTKHTGTGLGLAITHDIIQQHHGSITAENDPEGGAIFNVWLPVDERGN